jgi:NTP pyrophosphatase (non-canonical NTP hydrolase)
MSSTIADLIRAQREFDARHASDGRSWATPIGPDSIFVLLELTVALTGEVGEFANIAKKVARGDFALDAAKPDMALELADVLIYLFKLSDQLGTNLEEAFRKKLELNEKRFERFSDKRL